MRSSDWSSDVCSSDLDLRRARILALGRAGLAAPALRLAEPGLFDASQQRQIEAGAAAELVRLAPMPSRNEAERFVVADRAIARLDTLIARWRTEGDGAPEDIRRARLEERKSPRLNSSH